MKMRIWPIFIGPAAIIFLYLILTIPTFGFFNNVILPGVIAGTIGITAWSYDAVIEIKIKKGDE